MRACMHACVCACMRELQAGSHGECTHSYALMHQLAPIKNTLCDQGAHWSVPLVEDPKRLLRIHKVPLVEDKLGPATHIGMHLHGHVIASNLLVCGCEHASWCVRCCMFVL